MSQILLRGDKAHDWYVPHIDNPFLGWLVWFGVRGAAAVAVVGMSLAFML